MVICDDCKKRVDKIYLTEYVPTLAPMLTLCFDCDNLFYPKKPIDVLENYSLSEDKVIKDFTGIYIMEET